jgi:hypothetical protein
VDAVHEDHDRPANANLDALLSTAFGRGGEIDAAGYGVGDLFAQPVWLGKTRLADATSYHACPVVVGGNGRSLR